MRRARCPYCNNVNVIEDQAWGEIARCEGPRCGRIFQTGVEEASLHSITSSATTSVRRMPPPPAPVGPPPKPLLTGPHICHACGGEIGQAIARRRATVVHRLPARGDRPAGAPCRMDIYSALYYCPNAHCQVFLETPSSQWGQIVACPACKVEFVAPLDDVLHEHEGDAQEGQVFRFACPSCEAQLRCDSTRRGQPLTGRRVACRRCCQVIEIPAGGKAIARQGHSSPDPREALQQGIERRCGNPTCGRMVPAKAEHCPICGVEQSAEVPGV
jgi:hypothetical protein